MSARAPHRLSVALALAALSAVVTAEKAPAVPDLLKLAGAYLDQYAERLGAVAADEEYMQYETSTGQMGTPTRVNTHVLWLGVADGAVESYRDVVAIDFKPVRPKDERLLGLFKSPGETSRAAARELTDAAVSRYIDGNLHLLDEPTLALDFLRTANQPRSTFKLEGMKTLNGAPAAVLKFSEIGSERLVPSPEHAPAVGRFWIDPASGTVRQTELGLTARGYTVHVTVKYTTDAATSLVLPLEMTQHCQVSGGMSSVTSNMGAYGGMSVRQELEGRASYSNYRRVRVDLTRLK